MTLPDYVKRIDIPTPYQVGDVALYYFKNSNTTIDIGHYSKKSINIFDKNAILIDDLRVLATHGHDDHIGVAKKKEVGTLFLHPNDAEWLSYKYPGRPTVEKNLLKLGIPSKYMGGMFALLERIFSGFSLPNYEPLHEGQSFDIGNGTLVTIETPGHTLGSVSFFLKDEGILFAGDAVLADITSNPGTIFVVSVPIGKCNFDPIKNYLKTLNKLESIAPALIAGSHGRLVKNPKERIRELRKSYMERIEKTYCMLKTDPMTIFETARMIFKNHTAEDDLMLQLCEAMSYIYYLKNLNLIARKGLKWYAV